MAESSLTAERVREVLNFNAGTGLFVWRIKIRKNIDVGAVAGRLNHHGYVSIGLDSKKWQAHRLAWLYTTGVWPKGQIDHINGIRSDNRISNLRDVSANVNQQNRRSRQKNNMCGFMGVRSHGSGYIARIRISGILHCLGTFETPELASAAYLSAKRKMHLGCTI